MKNLVLYANSPATSFFTSAPDSSTAPTPPPSTPPRSSLHRSGAAPTTPPMLPLCPPWVLSPSLTISLLCLVFVVLPCLAATEHIVLSERLGILKSLLRHPEFGPQLRRQDHHQQQCIATSEDEKIAHVSKKHDDHSILTDFISSQRRHNSFKIDKDDTSMPLFSFLEPQPRPSNTIIIALAHSPAKKKLLSAARPCSHVHPIWLADGNLLAKSSIHGTVLPSLTSLWSPSTASLMFYQVMLPNLLALEPVECVPCTRVVRVVVYPDWRSDLILSSLNWPEAFTDGTQFWIFPSTVPLSPPSMEEEFPSWSFPMNAIAMCSRHSSSISIYFFVRRINR